jgi:uncharacterized repeat protein (TIGR03803 family)
MRRGRKTAPGWEYHVNSSVKSSLLVLLWIASHGVFVPGRLEAQLFTTLHNFDGKDGTGSAASLTLSSNCLFGTSPSGGTFGKGTVFRIHTDGSGFTNLHNFDGSDDGSAPQTGLVLSRTTLYGTAASGGKFNGGTLFAIQMDGSGFTNLITSRPIMEDHPVCFWRVTCFLGPCLWLALLSKARYSWLASTEAVLQLYTPSLTDRLEN